MAEQAKRAVTRAGAEIVVDRPGLRVIRFALGAGEALPPHFAPRDVAIVVTAGSGSVTVERRVIEVKAGSVVPLMGERHGVVANEPMTFVVVQGAIEAWHVATPVVSLAPVDIEVGWPSP